MWIGQLGLQMLVLWQQLHMNLKPWLLCTALCLSLCVLCLAHTHTPITLFGSALSLFHTVLSTLFHAGLSLCIARTHIRTNTHTHARMHTRTHTHTNTQHTHTHTNTQHAHTYHSAHTGLLHCVRQSCHSVSHMPVNLCHTGL